MGYLESLMGRYEGIVFKTRQHWLVVLPTILINSLLSLLIVVGSVFLVSRLGPWPLALDSPPALGLSFREVGP